MARKKKAVSEADSGNSFPDLKLISRETTNTILGIFSLVFSVFFLLGAFGMGGRAGTSTFEILAYLSGVGYYLIPIVFLLLALSLLHERERKFALPQIVGSLLLFLSGLAGHVRTPVRE